MIRCYHRPRINSAYIICKVLSKTTHLTNYPFSILEKVEEGCNAAVVQEDNPVDVVVLDIAVEAVQNPTEVFARNSAMEIVNSPVDLIHTLAAHTARLVAGRISEGASQSFPVETEVAAEDNRLGRQCCLALVLVHRNSGPLEVRTPARL